MIDCFDGVDEFYDTAGDPDQSLHLDPAEQVADSRAGRHLHQQWLGLPQEWVDKVNNGCRAAKPPSITRLFEEGIPYVLLPHQENY